jgi:hypothetical protein
MMLEIENRKFKKNRVGREKNAMQKTDEELK